MMWSASAGKIFLSTPSARRATLYIGAKLRDILNFYPRPPRGGRPARSTESSSASIFLSTPSARRATGNGTNQDVPQQISIHALREEGDLPAA